MYLESIPYRCIEIAEALENDGVNPLPNSGGLLFSRGQLISGLVPTDRLSFDSLTDAQLYYTELLSGCTGIDKIDTYYANNGDGPLIVAVSTK